MRLRASAVLSQSYAWQAPTLGDNFMLGSTFNRVVRSLSFFANNFTALTYYGAVLQRLQECPYEEGAYLRKVPK